jgi:hypothetical protein
MRLFAALTCLALACLLPAGSALAKGGALRADLTACTTGVQAVDRAATFVGTMPRIKGATRMEMRFSLLQKRPGDAYTRVTVPKWGSWVRSQPGVPSFSYMRRLEQLAAPAVYRVHVRFRWRTSSGAVVRRSERWSPVCEQPDPRPDLQIGSVKVTPADKGMARYDVVVRNTGRSDVSTSFDVTVGTSSGETTGSAGLTSLLAGSSQTVSITAPACTAGQRLRVVADAGGAVDEAMERNNSASPKCPATA